MFGFRRSNQGILKMLKYVTAVLAIIWTAISVPSGLAVWMSAVGHPPRQLPVFVTVLVFEGAAFAVGVVFLVFGDAVRTSRVARPHSRQQFTGVLT